MGNVFFPFDLIIVVIEIVIIRIIQEFVRNITETAAKCRDQLRILLQFRGTYTMRPLIR